MTTRSPFTRARGGGHQLHHHRPAALFSRLECVLGTLLLFSWVVIPYVMMTPSVLPFLDDGSGSADGGGGHRCHGGSSSAHTRILTLPKATKPPEPEVGDPDYEPDWDERWNLTTAIRNVTAEMVAETGGAPESRGGEEMFDFEKRHAVLLAWEFNRNGHMHNAHHLPPLKEGFIPILMMVHKKTGSLLKTIESLRGVWGIEETVLVVSHEGIFPQVWEAVQSIDFMRVKQLVHPFSPHLEANKERFPGDDPYFKKKNPATGLPFGSDKYRNPRLPRIVALKHHWWWAMNMVMEDRVPGVRGAESVFYIEDDHAVTPDFYRVAQSITAFGENDEVCKKECFVYNIASHVGRGDPKNANGAAFRRVGNIGLIFPRRSWTVLHERSSLFCEYDDYNWDHTLYNVMHQKGVAKSSLTTTAYHLRHMGKCGLHGKTEKLSAKVDVCNTQKDYDNFKRVYAAPVLQRGENGVPQPNGWKVGGKPIAVIPSHAGFGGWGSRQDRLHCLKIAAGEYELQFNSSARLNSGADGAAGAATKVRTTLPTLDEDPSIASKPARQGGVNPAQVRAEQARRAREQAKARQRQMEENARLKRQREEQGTTTATQPQSTKKNRKKAPGQRYG